MPSRVQQGAARMQHDPQPSPSGLEWDWNDVRVFLAGDGFVNVYQQSGDTLTLQQHTSASGLGGATALACYPSSATATIRSIRRARCSCRLPRTRTSSPGRARS